MVLYQVISGLWLFLSCYILIHNLCSLLPHMSVLTIFVNLQCLGLVWHTFCFEGDRGHVTYRGTKTRLKTRCGRTEYFEVKVGLHQGSALSPLLFIIIMDVLAEEAITKPP